MAPGIGDFVKIPLSYMRDCCADDLARGVGDFVDTPLSYTRGCADDLAHGAGDVVEAPLSYMRGFLSWVMELGLAKWVATFLATSLSVCLDSCLCLCLWLLGHCCGVCLVVQCLGTRWIQSCVTLQWLGSSFSVYANHAGWSRLPAQVSCPLDRCGSSLSIHSLAGSPWAPSCNCLPATPLRDLCVCCFMCGAGVSRKPRDVWRVHCRQENVEHRVPYA